MIRQQWAIGTKRHRSADAPGLANGSRVAVVGGGPAGSLFSYFLLELAGRIGLDLAVDIYEPRDFSKPGPLGCNMCGGIISETLVQNLAAEGVNLPETVVQRGIDSYVLHTDVGTVRIETPLHEKRIAAVHRGGGPRDLKVRRWESFDRHLLKLAVDRGASVIRSRVEDVTWSDGRPQIAAPPGPPQPYEFMAVAVGVNSPALKLFGQLDLGYDVPQATKTCIREYFVGEEVIGRTIGSSMHVFLLNIPRLEFAAIVPKGDYLSFCLLGEEIDRALIQAFVDAPEVRACMPEGWQPDVKSCQCLPRINVRGSKQPFADRVVFIGDCGVTRLYKDGIGAAYRTAKAAATTAVFEGIGTEDFRAHYQPACKAIHRDNALGKVIFAVTREIQRRRFARRALLRMTEREQRQGGARLMSQVLWDTFTGSAPYREIFLRTLRPAFLGGLLWAVGASIVGRRGQPEGSR
ncbi:MAG: NAD(P)/FAD-dependent oxidoreductase [Planctomycetota bacterium]|jgi:flavin-dependent dehydrogenase